MDLLQIFLRIVHIVSGVMWVGGAAFFFFFVEPTAKATAPESQKFMGYLMVRRHFGNFMSTVSLLTVTAGALLYWRASGFRLDWITSGVGLGFTLGALAGIIVYGVGFFMIRPRVERIGALSQAIQASGGRPSAEQVTELNRLQSQMSTLGKFDIVLLAVALLAMATARYWWVG